MANSSSFRGRLKRYRQERGWTQDDLAERVGCATQTIRKIEGGKRRPSYQMAARLAQVLQLSAEEHAAWIAEVNEMVEQESSAPESVAPPVRAQALGLPVYLTPFVGRELEQANLAKLLESPSSRLITLLGPGGIGKTRLAVEVARHVAGFPDGVAFVPLAPVAVPQAIVPTIANALGFSFSGPSDLTSQLLAYLHAKRILLILDNLEHLLDSSNLTLGLIEQMLAHASDLTLLVTSRERLKLPVAWVFEIEGLPVPPAGAVAPSSDYAALTLFMEHAQRVEQHFRLDATNYNPVATICQLVGGMPLGIELAATWLRMLSPEEISQELTRNLDAEHLSPGTLPSRHHSLWSVVDHSWELLSPVEREALRRLSVFHGGFTRQAAHIAEVRLPVLASLVDKSLLRRAAHGRYDLHEIIRQYAQARLRDNQAERAAIHDHHAAYYLGLLAELEPIIKSVQQAEATTAISTEIDNIRAAWHWAVEHDQFDELVRAAEVLQWFFENRSLHQEGVALLAHAVARLRNSQSTPSDNARKHTLGRLLGHYGFLAARIGAFANAKETLDESYRLLRNEDDPIGLSRTLAHQGIVAYWSGDFAEARRVIDQSMSLADAASDQWTMAFCESWAGITAHAQGNCEAADRLFCSALARWRTTANPRAIVWCSTAYSAMLIGLGMYQEAETLLRDGLLISQTTDDRYGTAMVLHQLGLIALAQQDSAEAVYLFRETLERVRAVGSWEVAETLNHLAAALWSMGTHAEAGKTYREALVVAREANVVPDMLQAVAGLAASQMHEQNYEIALELAVQVEHNAASRTETRNQARQLRAAIVPHLAQQQINRAEQRAAERPLEDIVTALLATWY